MRISINVTVRESGTSWGGPSVNRDIQVETESPQPESLPWAAICAGMVEKAICEFQELPDKEGE